MLEQNAGQASMSVVQITLTTFWNVYYMTVHQCMLQFFCIKNLYIDQITNLSSLDREGKMAMLKEWEY